MVLPDSRTREVVWWRRRRVAIGALSLVVVMAALTILWLVNGPSDSSLDESTGTSAESDDGSKDASTNDAVVESDDGPEDASTDPLAIPTPTPAPIGADAEQEVERATVAATTVLAAMDEIGARSDGSVVGIDLIATGFVLGELESYARQQLDLGYRQVGEAKVTSVQASDVVLDGTPPSMTLTVCVDVSAIDVLDAAGNSLKASLYNPGRPVKHVYGAQFVDGAWKLATHDIPDPQDCSIP